MCYYKDKICDEFMDAKSYLYKAEAVKDTDKELSDTLKSICEQELSHAMLIYKAATKRAVDIDKLWFASEYNSIKSQIEDYSKF